VQKEVAHVYAESINILMDAIQKGVDIKIDEKYDYSIESVNLPVREFKFVSRKK